MPLIETRNLKKYFQTRTGDLHAVDDVNLKIEKGQTLGVVGESGCGKSTLGRVILRLLSHTAGEVYFEGKNILEYNSQEMKKMRNKMQIIFQDPYMSLDPRMTASETIEEPLLVAGGKMSKAERTEKVMKLMDTVGLARRFVNSYPHELDGGRRQRIGIARALALDPMFIVCDEPVSALDVSIQAQILNLMMDLQEERGLSYMFITHDLSVVKHISNQIAVMYLGQCIELASTEELFANPVHPYTQALLSAIPIPDTSVRKEKQEIIRGEVSSPINPKPGCRFAARCPNVQPQCTKQNLPLVEISPGHFISCARYDKAK
ncbi:MAG: ABC transporter ATP-binding protein [Lachnospiraceae bacterium]